jgi:hypothetical protein
MLSAMAREGWHFTEIRVRVQVGAGAVPATKTTKNQRDASGARALFRLAAALSDGPLRHSLLAWSRRSRGR